MDPVWLSVNRYSRFFAGGNWPLRVGVLGTVALFLAFSWVCVLVDHAGHGGDFGQYVVQARNLAEGRSWSYLMEGFPAILPGYPAVLAVPTAVAGINFKLYGFVNSIAWVGTALLFLYYYRERLRSSSSLFVYWLGVLFCPLVMELQAEVQPNILFALSVAAALIAAERLKDGGLSPLRRVGWGGLLLVPALVRVEAIALFGSLGLYYILARRLNLFLLCALGVVVAVGMDVAIAIVYHQESNFAVVLRQFDGGLGSQHDSESVHSTVHAFAYMGSTYVDGLAEMSMAGKVYGAGPGIEIAYSDGLVAPTFLSAIVLAVLCLKGAWAHRVLGADKIYMAAHLVLLSMFLLEGGGQLRYLVPVFPIFWLYVMSGIESFVPSRIPPRAVAAGLAGLLLVPVLWGAWERHGLPANRNVIRTPEMIEVVQWISAHDVGAGVAYFKPRPLTMLLDGKAPSVPVKVLRSEAQARRYIQRSGFIFVVRRIRSYGQAEVMKFLQRDRRAEVVLENKEMIIFRVRDSTPGAEVP